MSDSYVASQPKALDAANTDYDDTLSDEDAFDDAEGDDERSEQEILDEAKKRYKEADDAWEHVLEAALADLRFARLSEQWPAAIARQRELDGRPVLTINKLPAFIRQVVNDARQNKPTIRVRPVDSSSDPHTADVFNGLIRHIEANSDADIAYDTAIDCSVTQGIGFFYIDIDYATDTGFEKEIYIRRISNPQAVRFDAASTAADSSDWRYAFVTEMMPKAEFKKKFPDAETADWDGDSGEDNLGWFTEDEVRVAAYWCKEETQREIVQLSNGEVVDAEDYDEQPELWSAANITETDRRVVRETKVICRAMSGAAILETTEWAGKYIPVVPVFGEEVNEDGKRIFQSLIRHAKDSQRQLNYFQSTATEVVALAPKAPYIGPENAFDVEGEAEKWATANTQSHPYLRYKGAIPPTRQEFAGVPAGALTLAGNAADDIKTVIGIHDANMGLPGNETSGRAILARQHQGDVGSFHFIDNLTRAIRCAGKILVDLIPHVYSGKRMVRILGEDKQPIMVALGQRPQGSPQPGPVQAQQPQASQALATINGMLQQQAQANGVPPQNVPQLNLPPELLATLDGMQHVYDLGVGQYDVECMAGPSFTSRRQETAEAIFALMEAFPQGAPALADILLQNLDFPDADKIAQRMQALQAQQANAGKEQPPAVPDVVGAAKVQSDAKIQANRESLAAERQMNMDKLANERQMQQDKMMFDANQSAQDHAAGQAETHSKNATSVLTTAMKNHATQQAKAPILGAIPAAHATHNPLNPGI